MKEKILEVVDLCKEYPVKRGALLPKEIGMVIVSSAQQRDFPVVVFGVLVISASVTFVNLLVDLSYGLLDPRIRDH